MFQTPLKNGKASRRGTMLAGDQSSLIGSPQPGKSSSRPGTTIKKTRPRLSMIGSHLPKHHEERDTKVVELSSPTSISMKNSYIIKNADSSFDSYYNSMRKRTKNNQILNIGSVTGGNNNNQTL